MDYMGRSMKAQMKDANRENARFAIIVGDHELEANRFTFRDMEKSVEDALSFEEILQRFS
jgi:histidyl-tRNA synthetase